MTTYVPADMGKRHRQLIVLPLSRTAQEGHLPVSCLLSIK